MHMDDPLHHRMNPAERGSDRNPLSDLETLRGIIDAVPHPIFVKDEDCRFLIVNETMCKLMGRDFSELIGKTDHDFCPPGQADIYRDNDRLVLEQGEINENEEPFSNASGEVRTIVTRKKRFCTTDGARLLIGCITDISDFRHAEAAIRFNAEHDHLTGIANRMLFRTKLEKAVADASDNACDTALLMIDLDGFKEVNDALGHGAGDNVLVQTARALAELVESPDHVARLGGDEFAILQRCAPQPKEAARLAAATIARLGRPTYVGRHQVAISASVGLAFIGQSSDPETLMRHADLALYAAKRQGRNRWLAFDPAMEAAAVAA
jgi:diguanylate cyclase (GGDEF)-like protein/PAS domain S-box-containing protein